MRYHDSIPPKYFKALSNAADDAPNKEEVFPVINFAVMEAVLQQTGP